MDNNITYTVTETGNIATLPHEDMDNNPSAEIARIQFMKQYPNTVGYLMTSTGELLGLTTNENFSKTDVPDGWKYDDEKIGVIVPDLSTNSGQNAYKKFNEIGFPNATSSSGGFSPNASDVSGGDKPEKPQNPVGNMKPTLQQK